MGNKSDKLWFEMKKLPEFWRIRIDLVKKIIKLVFVNHFFK